MKSDSKVLLARFQSLLALVLMVVALSLASDQFLTISNLRNILLQISINLCLSIGMTLIILSGGIDLSVGSVVGLTGVLCAGLLSHGAGVPAALAAALALGVGIGVVNAVAITQLKVPAFIVTLAMMQVASGLAYKIAAGQSVYDIPYSFTALSRNGIAVLLVVYVVAHVVMSRMRLGRYLYAVGGNREVLLHDAAGNGLLKRLFHAFLANHVRKSLWSVFAIKNHKLVYR